MVVTDYRTKTSEDIMSPEVANEWRRLAAECGLTALVESQDSGEVVIGWQKLDNQTKHALEWLCPQETTLDKYKHDVPPVEALGLISLAQMQGEFDKVTIRFNDRLPDPVAIGYKKDERYLICAWGPEEMPVEAWVDKFRRTVLERFEGFRERAIATLRTESADKAINEWLSYGHLYGKPIDLAEMR